MDCSARRIGFWSSLFATGMAGMFLVMLMLTFVVFKLDLTWQGIEHFAEVYPEGQILLFVIPCFLLAPAYLMFTVCLYKMAPERDRIVALISVVFAVIYAAQISQNYFLQMSAVRLSIKAGLLEGLTPFAFGNLYSTFWSMEVLGYTFLSFSMICSGLLFRGSGARRAIRWIFLVNGIWGVWALFELVLEIPSPPISLIVFAVTFPISTALIGHLFRKGDPFAPEGGTEQVV